MSMSGAGACPLAGRIPAAAAPMRAALFFRNFLRPDDLDSMGAPLRINLHGTYVWIRTASRVYIRSESGGISILPAEWPVPWTLEGRLIFLRCAKIPSCSLLLAVFRDAPQRMG